MKKNPNPVDVYVGQRLRMRRMLMGMSQSKLGEQINLTFQQVQKYEKGTNRIGASRLFEFSKVLDVPVQYFFENIDVPSSLSGITSLCEKETNEKHDVIDYVNTAEGLKLNRAICAITDVDMRRKIINLIVNISLKY